MKANLIDDLIKFVDMHLFEYGNLVAISEKGSEYFYSTISNTHRCYPQELVTDSWETISVENVYDVIVFAYEEVEVPRDIRDLIRVINKTNKEYGKIDSLGDVKTMTLFVDCENEPVFLEDYDLESINLLVDNFRLVKYRKLSDNEMVV